MPVLGDFPVCFEFFHAPNILFRIKINKLILDACRNTKTLLVLSGEIHKVIVKFVVYFITIIYGTVVIDLLWIQVRIKSERLQYTLIIFWYNESILVLKIILRVIPFWPCY